MAVPPQNSPPIVKQWIEKEKERLLKLKNEIHAEFGKESLILKTETINAPRRLALWERADLLLNTSLREGLCLAPLEYLAVKTLLGLEN